VNECPVLEFHPNLTGQRFQPIEILGIPLPYSGTYPNVIALKQAISSFSKWE